MKQVWNIFLKDVRHHWREIAISMVLVVAYGWNEIREWALAGNVAIGWGGVFSYRFLSGLIVVLLPIAWAFMVVRVVQSESLVGDRQFWVTRPYEWKKLLAAKVLFVLAFVNLPLLVLDVFLLAKAGFRPASYISGLLWMQVLIALYFMLPVAALAAVTATLVQILLALLIIVLYGIGLGLLSDQIPSSSFSGPADSLTGALALGVCLAVVCFQYARRQTTRSRLLIVGLAGVLLLIMVATPYGTIVAHEFPEFNPGQQPPFQLALLPPEKTESAYAAANEEGKEVEIQLPMSVSGLEPDSMIAVDGFMVILDAPNGLRWNSGWKSQGLSFFSGDKMIRLNFSLKKSVFDRFTSSAVNLRLSMAFSQSHETNRRDFVTPSGWFRMPEVGLCSTEPYYREIHCLAPLRGPKPLVISADMSTSTCPLREGESLAIRGEIARYWGGNNASDQAELSISPVKIVELYLLSGSGTANAGVCPGTPLVLSNPKVVRRNRIELLVGRIRLAEYQPESAGFIFGIKPR
jgi:hypothetical protein